MSSSATSESLTIIEEVTEGESGNRKRHSNGDLITAAEDDNSKVKTGSISASTSRPPLKRSKGARWRTHQQCEDYVNFVGDLMYPKTKLGPYGFEPEKGRFPIEKISTLGYFTSSLRRPTVIEKWSPYEIALFESAIMLYGKSFHSIKQYIQSKTVKEVIEFYYEWKNTSHYKQWKAVYKVDDRDLPVFDDS